MNRKAIASATKIPLVFVGTGRCGTHMPWKVFESVPGTLSTHERSCARMDACS